MFNNSVDKLPENIQSAILDLFAPYREAIEKPLPGGHTIWDKYQHETLVLPNGEDQREFLIRFPDIELQSDVTHWEGSWNGNNNPVTNVVVHGRANTRYTPENFKVLFGEEFQSDWKTMIGFHLSFGSNRIFTKSRNVN